jgi:hypothetical protein
VGVNDNDANYGAGGDDNNATVTKQMFHEKKLKKLQKAY